MQRVGGLVELPALLREQGANADQVLASAGLDARVLDSADNRIPFVAAARLLHHGAQATGCPHFGLLAGQRWSLSHFGALGQLMLNSPTVGDALRALAVFQRLHSDVGAAILIEHAGTAALGYTIYRESVPHQALVYDLAIAFAYNILRELCGPRWAASEVTLSRDDPPDPTPYRMHFRAPLRFHAEYSAVRFTARWFEHAIPGADAERYRALSQALEGSDSSELVPQVRRALRLLLISGKSSGNDLAQTLSLHRRTLNRRLQAQGTTFQKVLDQVRFEVARQLLEDTRAPIADVAAALCYADVAAFTHAFRRWSGTTPAKWRDSAGASSARTPTQPLRP
jgi:AraC-like DNA-binding protein